MFHATQWLSRRAYRFSGYFFFYAVQLCSMLRHIHGMNRQKIIWKKNLKQVKSRVWVLLLTLGRNFWMKKNLLAVMDSDDRNSVPQVKSERRATKKKKSLILISDFTLYNVVYNIILYSDDIYIVEMKFWEWKNARRGSSLSKRYLLNLTAWATPCPYTQVQKNEWWVSYREQINFILTRNEISEEESRIFTHAKFFSCA